MVRMAPHRGGVARRGVATEMLCIELQRLGTDMLSNGKAQ